MDLPPHTGLTVSGRPSLGGRIAEHGDRGDKSGTLGGSGLLKPMPGPAPRDDVDHPCALRVPAEHQPGVGAVVHHVLDVAAGVVGAGGGLEEVVGRGVVDRVGADGPAADLAAQRVDESTADASEARRLIGAAREHDLDVGAALCGRGPESANRQTGTTWARGPRPRRPGWRQRRR